MKLALLLCLSHIATASMQVGPSPESKEDIAYSHLELGTALTMSEVQPLMIAAALDQPRRLRPVSDNCIILALVRVQLFGFVLAMVILFIWNAVSPR